MNISHQNKQTDIILRNLTELVIKHTFYGVGQIYHLSQKIQLRRVPVLPCLTFSRLWISIIQIMQHSESEHYIIEQDNLCQLRNFYHIYTSDESRQSFQEAGQFQEEPNEALSFFCCSNRPSRFQCNFKGDLYSVAFQPFRLCLWELGCCPPSMVVTQKEIVIGTIKCPQKCFQGESNQCSGLLIQVIDKSNNVIYSIQNKCCVLSSLCDFTRICTQQKVQYPIRNGKGEVVGVINNIYDGWKRSLFTSQDKWSIEFPTNIPLEHKKLLLNSVIFIDFLRWEF